MRRAKRCKDKVNPAQLAACKILANTQASEDVVCSAHTSFGGAARALGARRAASIMEDGGCSNCGKVPDPHASRQRTIARNAVVIAAARRQALLKNRGRTWPPTPSTPPQAASGQKLKRARTRAATTLGSGATATPTP